MARKRVHFMRMTIGSIMIQKFTRRWLAKRELVRRRKNKAAISIQTKSRVVLAKRERARLKAEWILSKKVYVCVQLQSHYRRRKAVRLRNFLKREKCATQIQCMFRCHKARQVRKQREVYMGKVRKLQRFYKRRHRRKINCATKITSNVRRYLTRKRYLRLRNISIAAFKISNMIHTKDKSYALTRWKRENGAVIIQAFYRGVVGRRKHKSLLREKAMSKLRYIFTKSYCTKLCNTLRYVNKQMHEKATVISKNVRRFLAKKR